MTYDANSNPHILYNIKVYTCTVGPTYQFHISATCNYVKASYHVITVQTVRAVRTVLKSNQTDIMQGDS